MRSYLEQTLYLDLRSLRLFRIGLGLVCLMFAWEMFPHIDAFLGRDGVTPLSAPKPVLHWSVFGISDSPLYLRSVFVIFAAAALLLMAGLQTRLAILVCWIFTTSIEHRVPAIIGGDMVALKTLLLWSLFLPLQARWSLSRRLLVTERWTCERVLSAGTIGFSLQVMLIYISNAVMKSQPAWTKDGSALYIVFNLADTAQPVGQWLAQFPNLLVALTLLTPILEYGGTLLLLVPSWRLRSLAVVSFFLLHCGIYLTIDVGWFPAVMIVCWLAFVPSEWWGVRREERTQVIFRWSEAIVVGVLMVFFLVLNIGHVRKVAFDLDTNPMYSRFAKWSGLHQIWNQYVGPRANSVSYEFIPVFESEAPEHHALRSRYRFPEATTRRWKRFLRAPHQPKNRHYFDQLQAYLTRRWNKEFPQGPRVKTVKIVIHKYTVLADSRTKVWAKPRVID